MNSFLHYQNWECLAFYLQTCGLNGNILIMVVFSWIPKRVSFSKLLPLHSPSLQI